MLRLSRFRFVLFPTLLSTFLLAGCPRSGAVNNTTAVHPAATVVREFYTALANNERDRATRLLAKKGNMEDPKSGSLLVATASMIATHEGIERIDIEQVTEPYSQTVKGYDGQSTERLEIRVLFEVTFNDGHSERSTSLLVYEPISPERSEGGGSGDDGAQEFGWRLDFIHAR